MFINGGKNQMNKTYYRFIAFMLVLIAVFSVPGCKKASPIGDIVNDVLDTPITALMFEMGEDGGVMSGGVVYRKVNDISQLLAQEKVPVLIVFMDGRSLSNAAIPFTEELCDRFSTTARIVRVNVGLSGNTTEIDNLISLFGVSDYPWFAVTYNGQKKTAISGYSTAAESDIINMIQNATK